MRENAVMFTGVLRNMNAQAAEVLWRNLKSLRPEGIKFTRNAAIGDHVADFVCPESKVVLMLSGAREILGSGKDMARSIAFAREGYKVFRVSEMTVMTEAGAVLEVVRANCI